MPPLFFDAMKKLIWVFRLFLFLCFFIFALQNTESVVMRLLPGQSVQAPLAIFLLVFFAVGALLGVFSLLGLVFRQRREIASLRRQVRTTESEPKRAPEA